MRVLLTLALLLSQGKPPDDVDKARDALAKAVTALDLSLIHI